jgi:hypothetical protein
LFLDTGEGSVAAGVAGIRQMQPFAVGCEWPLSGTSKLQTQQARDWHLTNPEPHQ